jgi:hypothetical protein
MFYVVGEMHSEEYDDDDDGYSSEYLDWLNARSCSEGKHNFVIFPYNKQEYLEVIADYYNYGYRIIDIKYNPNSHNSLILMYFFNPDGKDGTNLYDGPSVCDCCGTRVVSYGSCEINTYEEQSDTSISWIVSEVSKFTELAEEKGLKTFSFTFEADGTNYEIYSLQQGFEFSSVGYLTSYLTPEQFTKFLELNEKEPECIEKSLFKYLDLATEYFKVSGCVELIDPAAVHKSMGSKVNTYISLGDKLSFLLVYSFGELVEFKLRQTVFPYSTNQPAVDLTKELISRYNSIREFTSSSK